MAVPLELKSFSLLFESRDIINILLTLFFSVRTLSYGTSFFPHTSPLCHKSERKKLGPYLTVRPSNSISKRYVWWEISALESLWNAGKPWFPRLKPIHTRWTSRISVPLTEWLRLREAFMMLAKTINNIPILSNKRKRRFVQVFPFSWSS